MSPDGPEPTIAIFSGRRSTVGGAPFAWCARSQSATNRSSLPMPTGSNRPITEQRDSHWCSTGQTRPQIAGRTFFVRISAAAPAKSWSATQRTNRRIGTPTGQPCSQTGSWHWTQRRASASARSTV